jgi:hypothetical protein
MIVANDQSSIEMVIWHCFVPGWMDRSFVAYIDLNAVYFEQNRW